MSKNGLRLFFIAIIVVSIFTVAIVQFGHNNQIYQTSTVPHRPVALVLGASLKSGKPSGMLADRLDTAVELYTQGKVKKLIVSGDNRTQEYNEPLAMKKYLIEQGISKADIIPDYAGRRTYDSCYRMKEIFSQTSMIVVTQRFHLPRALYICKELGIDAIGVSADKARYHSLIQHYVREFFASIKAWLDVSILKPEPILGNKEPVF